MGVGLSITKCTEHSHYSASPYLLHVVVICPPPQHVHTEMRLSAQTTHPVIMEKTYDACPVLNSDGEYVKSKHYSISYSCIKNI